MTKEGGNQLLQELVIRNFAIIHQLSLSFQEGMTVLTGETGAGKSIIIDAVGLLAGGRGSSEFVRHGEKKCVLEAMFTYDGNEDTTAMLDEFGVESEEGQVILQREIYANGRNVCRANGTLITISALRAIGETLIDIHGQNEHQELMQPDRHLSFLDQFAGKTVEKARQEYRLTFEAFKKARKELEKWEHNEQELAQRLDMLRFQIEEIGNAELIAGEEETLTEEKNILANYQKVMEALNLSYHALQGEENNGLDKVGIAMDALESIQELDAAYRKISEVVSSGFFQLQEAASDLYRKLDELAYDEERLNEIEARLDLIHQLKRKYGDSVAAILSYFDKATEELEQIEDREGQLEKLNEAVKKLSIELLQKGKVLTQKRKQAAKQLEKAIHEQLNELYMEKVKFSVRFEEIPEDRLIKRASEDGLDEAEFYIATNVGEPLKPLAKVASGGELSRMMLAMKTIFSSTQGITSIIFDEVDTGVSGRVAQAIANKMHAVAVHSQVLCITHLPQVAAMADHHYYISKEQKNERTETHVESLNREQEIHEIARMLAGTEITDLTIQTARELKELSNQHKKTVWFS